MIDFMSLIVGFLSGVLLSCLIYVYMLRELLNDVIDLTYELMDNEELRDDLEDNGE